MEIHEEMTEAELVELVEMLKLPIHEVRDVVKPACKSLLTTIAQARKVYDNSPDGSEEWKQALERWGELSMREVAKITTIAQAQEVCDNSPCGSKAREKALEKWLSLCTTIAQAREVYDNSPSGSKAEKQAIRIMIELYLID